MALTCWNGSLASACMHFDGASALASNSTPSSGEATTMWKGAFVEIGARWGAAGITYPSPNSALTLYARQTEAFLVSCRVGEAFEIKTRGEVSAHTRWLQERASANIALLIDKPEAAVALGCTVTEKQLRPASMHTEFPNPDLDTSNYESPLSKWDIDGDL